MPRVVRCSLIQASNAAPASLPLEDVKEAMIGKHLALIGQAAEAGAQITCLQEIFYGPYFCAEQQTRWYDFTEPIPGGPTADLRTGDLRFTMNTAISGIPASFTPLLAKYCNDITEATEKGRHHDQRRNLLMDFLRNAFHIQVDEIELELKIKANEARGRIDAFYKFVIFEFKIDFERERPDAVRQLKKYFESRFSPSDYIAAVTDGVTVEVYDYDLASAEAKHRSNLHE